MTAIHAPVRAPVPSVDDLTPNAAQLQPVVPLRVLLHRLRSWLPEGRKLPEAIWERRHRGITQFALLQAAGIGVFALLRGYSVLGAVADVLVVGFPAAMGASTLVGRQVRTMSVTVSLMFASAAVVDVAGGVTEAHFHFFVMLGIVSLYQDWSAFGLCILIVVFHHAVMGLLSPARVYGTSDAWNHPVQLAFVHGGFVLSASITHLIAWKASEQQELSDPLTRLRNRTAFVEALDRRLGVPSRAVSVLFVDIDNFKSINDSGGHHIGDIALRHVAQRMVGVVRDGDLVARLGGDEFAVLVSGNAAAASAIGERISQNLQAPVYADGRELFIQASIGVADSELAGSRDSADLLRDADLAMYLAKSSGKNQVVTYTAGVDKIVRERAALAADIRHALESGQFEVHYQPLVDGNTGRVRGVEALLRWNHPTRGLVSPVDFIPIAEETGEINVIGAWVLQTAASQVVRWQRQLPGCRELELSVNLSPVQLRDPDLLKTITSALVASGLKASELTLEVTEGMLLQDLELSRRQLDSARALGARVAIDDFGTGYSSLSYLAKLPADEVKIDRSFIKELGDHPGAIALVKGIIDMARALHLDILAEGVEEVVQQDILSELGCARSQGYLFSRPLSVDAFQTFAAAGGLSPAEVIAAADAVGDASRPGRSDGSA
ncbi:MAG: diguanylate cyclase/phosphodiesterase [Frankiales bacterium]|nr:diguanylate cyclase/phosphodiesterase [Frankiales bacterium]